MFIHNKYYYKYLAIIKKAQSLPRVKTNETRFENHHIIPKSFGGTNNKENLVLLTANEHYVCHHLLTKCTEGIYQTKMLFAFWRLATTRDKDGRTIKITSKVYAKLREQIAIRVSQMNTGRIVPPVTEETSARLSESKKGEKNPMFGKPAPNRGIKRPGIGGRKKGFKWSDADRKSYESARSVPGYYDYLRDPERCKKISDANKGRTGIATGKTWFNNGEIEQYSFTCPEGFVKGRKPRKSTKQGLLWFNNGTVNRQYKLNSQPEGFVRGRISKK